MAEGRSLHPAGVSSAARVSRTRMLRQIMRHETHGGRPKKNLVRAAPSFAAELRRLNLVPKRAIEAQRIGTLT